MRTPLLKIISTCTLLFALGLNAKVPHVLVIMGSVRIGRTAEKIAQAIVANADKNNIDLEIIDLLDYNLPVIDLENKPTSNKEIIAWGNKISQADAVIFLTPNYNEGYSGVLKNAIDALTTEWNNKLVGIIAYSGGPDGGKKPSDFLVPVLERLHMKPLLNSVVLIPYADGAVIESKTFKKQAVQDEITALLNTIIKALS